MTISEVTGEALETFLADDQRGRRRLPARTVDASVVAASERLGITDVATLDRRHLGVVRPSHVEALTIVTGQ